MRHIHDAETTAAILFKNEGTEQDWGREKRDCPILLINFYQSKSQKRGIICWPGGQGQFSYPGNVATCILVGDAAGIQLRTEIFVGFRDLMEVDLSLRRLFTSYSAMRSTILKTSINSLLLIAVVLYSKFVIVIR